MSTDIAVPEPTPDLPAVQHGAPAVPTGLMAWAIDARNAAAIAKSLAATPFVPNSMNRDPNIVTGAILAGHELGLSPMASLRSIDIIQGTPALRAHAMRALVQSHGHDIGIVEASDTRVVMRGRRRGDEDWQTVEWTIQRAAKLGLTSKQQWKAQPQTMLTARATGELARLIAADVLYAMPYASEELDGYTDRPAAAKPSAQPVQAVAEVPSGPMTLAELTAASAPVVVPAADGESLGRTVQDAPDVAEYVEEPPADDEAAMWPEAAAPGSKGGA